MCDGKTEALRQFKGEGERERERESIVRERERERMCVCVCVSDEQTEVLRQFRDDSLFTG